MKAYLKALQSRKAVAAIPDGMTRAEAEAAIASLGAELKGPMHNAMRVSLVRDRDNFRDVLRLMNERDAAKATAPVEATEEQDGDAKRRSTPLIIED